MSVPGFQEWFMPLLQQLGDSQLHSIADMYGKLSDLLKLSKEDQAEMLPSGKQKLYQNRIGWSRTYLKKAGLVESPKRGQLQITPRGMQVLADPPEELNVKFLKQYPEFVEFHTVSKDKGLKETDSSPDDEALTPIEMLEHLHGGLQNQFERDVLEKVKAASPLFFEGLVVDLLVKMGYGGSREDAGQIVGRSGDGGIDGVINEDRLGLDVICIQAKRWDGTVGRPIVQAFAGSLEGARAKKGVLITTSNFSSDAQQYIKHIEKRIVLVDGKQLAKLMVEHGVGVSVETQYTINRIDIDYFEED